MTLRRIRDKQRWTLLLLALFLSLCIAVVVVPAIYAAYEYFRIETAPPLIYYQRMPIPVADRRYPGELIEATEMQVFHPGDEVRLLPTRCVSNDGGTGTGVLLVLYTYSIVNDETGAILDRPTSGQLAAPVGCVTTETGLGTIPADIPAGVYHSEGIVGTFVANRASQIRWYSESYRIEP